VGGSQPLTRLTGRVSSGWSSTGEAPYWTNARKRYARGRSASGSVQPLAVMVKLVRSAVPRAGEHARAPPVGGRFMAMESCGLRIGWTSTPVLALCVRDKQVSDHMSPQG
jgi:hypothetical protein